MTARAFSGALASDRSIPRRTKNSDRASARSESVKRGPIGWRVNLSECCGAGNRRLGRVAGDRAQLRLRIKGIRSCGGERCSEALVTLRVVSVPLLTSAAAHRASRFM